MGHATHYKNKFPGGKVIETDHSIDVYDANGKHQIAMRKNGAGQMICKSEEYGLDSKHCLEPIPKDARVHKRSADGKHGLSEEHEERRIRAGKIAVDGKIQSIVELKKQGWTFNDDGSVKTMPKKGEPVKEEKPESAF